MPSHLSFPHDRSLTISRRFAALLPMLCALLAFAAPAHAQTSSVPTYVRVGIGNGNLTIYWQPAANASSYNLYRGTTAGGESATAIATGITAYNGNAYYYTDNGLTNGTTYYYEVTANTFNGESAPSAEVSGTPNATVLAAPVLTGTPGNGQAVLNWNAIPGATRYELYKLGANNQYFGYAFGITGTTYTDAGLANGTTYTYFVAAIDKDGSGTGSNGVAVTPGEVVPPAPPFVHTYTANGSTIGIQWNSVAGATGYNIYRGTSSGGEGATPYSTSATSTYNNGYITYFNDGGVTAGTTYYYFVTAKNSVGESAHSNETSGLLNAANGAPPELTATVATSPAKVTLNWGAIAGATSYDIFKAVAGTNDYIVIASATGTSYVDTNVITGVSYSYVITYNVGVYDQSVGSNTVTVTPGGAAGRNPTNLAAFPYNGGIVLTWDAALSVTGYNIYRGTGAGHESTTPIATNVTGGYGPFPAPAFFDPTAVSGTTYYYFVKDTNGNAESGSTNEASATAGAATLAAPTLRIATNASNDPVLTWSAIPGATGYNVYRNFSGGPYTNRVLVTTTTYTDTGINIGAPYNYYVAAVGVSGQGGNSNVVTFSPGQPPPPAPSGLTASIYNGTTVSLTWTPVPGATSYDVFEGTSAGGESATPVLTGVTNPSNLLVGNLTAGTTYYFKVSALSNAGESALSNEASATPNGTALAAPTLVVTTPSTTEADLSWSAVTGATSYVVYRSVGVTNSFVYYQSLTATTYKNTGLTAGLTYAYYVVPVSVNGLGTASNTVTVLLGGAALPAPTGTYAYPSGNSIVVVWNAAPGASSYNVYRGTSSSGEGAIPIATGLNSEHTGPNDRQFVDSNTVPGTVYYYKVTAVDSYGESAKSSEAAATAGGASLAAPTLTATHGSSSITLSWSAVSGATSYTLRRTDGNGNYSTLITTTATSYTDTTAAPGVTYSYYLFANNALGGGNNSNTVTTTAGSQVPPAPTGLVAQPYSSSYAYLTWNPVVGATSYNVYRGTTSGGEAALPIAVGVGGTGYYDESTVTGTKYYYYVTAVNAGGESGKSNEATVLTGSTLLAAPTLAAATSSGKVVLTWNTISGATSYNVYREIANQGYVLYTSVTTATYADTSVTNGLSYSYQVYAVSASGYGNGSNQVTVTPGASAPPAPTGLTALQEGYYIQLNWNPVPGISNYNIYRSTTPGGEGATPIATNAANGYGVFYYYNDSNVTAGTKYYYQVTAVSSVGEGVKSNEASAIDGTSPLGVPSVSGIPGNGQVVLNWSAVSGATSYDVYQSTTGTSSSQFLYVANTTATTYTATGLTNGVPYFYSIVAVGASGRAPSGSNPITVVPGTTLGLPAPTGLTVANDGNLNLALNWNAVIGASYYSVYRATQSGKEGNAPIASVLTNSSFTDGNVVPGITYFYQVTASNNFTESAKSTEASAQDAVAAPAAPVLQVTASGTSAILTWSKVANATSYNVFRSIAGASYTLITSTTAQTYANGGLSAGTSYTYYVTAVGPGGQSGAGNTATVTIGSTALPAPTGVYVYSQGNSLLVAWNTVPGATNYNIYRGTSAGGEGATPYNVGYSNTSNNGLLSYFSDYNVTSKTTYYYFVTATNAAGESAHSNEVSATYGLGQLPAPNLTGRASGGEIFLNWTAVAGAASYQIFRSVGATGNYSFYATTGGLTYGDTAVTTGIAYGYIVCAVNVNGHGANSNTVSLYSTGLVLPAPAGLTAGPSGASNVYLQWNPVNGATSYNIYRGTTANGEATKPITTGVTSSTNGFAYFVDTTSVSGTTYYYKVSAVDATGESAESNEASAAAGSAPLPAPTLSGVLGSPGSGQINLTWTAVPGATSYALYRGFSGSVISYYKGGLTGTTYTDTGISSTLSYSYYIVAVATINAGTASNTITLVPAGNLTPAPTGVYAFPVSNTATQVVWNAVPGASSYNVYRGTSPGHEGVAPIATGVTNTYGGNTRYYIQDNGLTAGVPYYYYVTAVSANGEGGKSAEAEAIPGGALLPAPILAGVAGNGSAILTWTAVSGATSYVLFRSDPLNNNYYTAIQSGLTATTYTDTNVTNGVSYDYVVETVNANGQGGGSNTVAVTPGTSAGNPLTAPVLVASGNDNSVTLTWSNVPGATAYVLYRGTTPGGENSMPLNASIGVSAGGVTSYTDSTASNYTTYYYKVAAADGFGVGAQSNEATSTPPNQGAGDFLLTATPNAISIAAGDEDTVSIGTNPVNGLGTSVTLTISGVPANVTATFDPAVAGSGGSYLTLTPGANAAPGSYTLTITGTSGSLTHTAKVVLVVAAAGSQQTMARQIKMWDGKARPAATSVDSRRASLLNDIGTLALPVGARQVAAWRTALHDGRVGVRRAAQMHLWLGEYALAHDEQPEQALAQFRQAKTLVASLPAPRDASLTDSPARLRTLSAYDSAFALFYMGAYAQSRDAFHSLLAAKGDQPGLDRQTCSLWWRHGVACAGYHSFRAAQGIPEPPRLDPKCGVAALATCLKGLNLPYDEARLMASCRVTGEGSNFGDIQAAAKKLGVTMRSVVADDRGLVLLPKPVVAYIEHDHFIAVTKADASGVSYLCSDCGAWPGGAVHLDWKQWHLMEATGYGVVTVPGSAWDGKFSAMEAYDARRKSGVRLQVASTNLAGMLPSIGLLTLAAHIHPNFAPAPGTYCGYKPNSPKCPPQVTCATPPRPNPCGPSGGDPAILATGEMEYTPNSDITVYNPYGPAVTWSRIYDSLRSPQIGAYEAEDYGVGWSTNYNVGVYDASPGATGTKYVFYPNGARNSFTAPAVPTAAAPVVQCTVPTGVGMLVEWDYSATKSDGTFKITFADRTKWVTTGTTGYPQYVHLLSQIVDRNGNAIAFNYQAPLSQYDFPLLQSITDPVHKTQLLTIKRANDGTGNIVTVTDAYGRSIYYHNGYYPTTHVPNGYPQSYQQVDHISQVVTAKSVNRADRWMHTYILASNREGSEQTPYMNGITMPSPTGVGTGTAYHNYDPNTGFLANTVDANGNTQTFTSVDANGATDTNGSYTRVNVTNPSGVLEYSYTVGFDSNMNETAMYTTSAPVSHAAQSAHGKLHPHNLGVGYPQYSYAYADPNDPYKPSSVTDANGHTTNYTYDAFGNTLTETTARGTVLTNTYPTTNFGLGELTKTTLGTKSPITYAYYDSTGNDSTNSGLVKTITGPTPGTSGSTSTVTTTYTYDALGNVLTVVTPGNSVAASVKTAFNYTADGSYTQPDKIGQPLTVTDNLGHVTHFRYDTQGNTLSQTDALGYVTTQTFNIADQPVTTTFPATGQGGSKAATQTISYLYPGGVRTKAVTTDEAGATVREIDQAYGGEAEITSVTGSVPPVSYTYNALYDIASVADGNGKTTQYYYNQADFLAAVTFPGYTGAAYPNVSGKDSVTFPDYDPLGNALTRIDGNGVEADFTYNDPENKLTDVKYPSKPALNVHTTYDAYGRRMGMTDGTGSNVYNYDDFDRATSAATTYTGLTAQTISYGYNPDGSRSTMTTPAGAFAYTYDAAQRPTQVKNPANETTVFSYQNNNRSAGETLANGASATYTYNGRGFLTDLVNKASGGAVLSEFGGSTMSTQMVYDAVGNRTQMTATSASSYPYVGTTSYQYDDVNQLMQETSTRSGSFTNNFAYDAAGNPTTFRSEAGNTFSPDNQITAFKNSAGSSLGTFAYDGNGNPTTYEGTALAFDPQNRMTAFGTALTAAYTGDGLRAWKAPSSGVKTYFLYDGTSPIVELSSTGAVSAYNTFEFSQLVSRRVGTTSTFYVFDPQGNVVQRLNSANAVTSSVFNDAFGMGTSNADPFGYGGQFGYYTDVETGLSLLTHRYYDAKAGRFLTRDPIGFVGGANIYLYAGNRPTVVIDPNGEDVVISVGGGGSFKAGAFGGGGEAGGAFQFNGNGFVDSAPFATGSVGYGVSAGVSPVVGIGIGDLSGFGGASGNVQIGPVTFVFNGGYFGISVAPYNWGLSAGGSYTVYPPGFGGNNGNGGPGGPGPSPNPSPGPAPRPRRPPC